MQHLGDNAARSTSENLLVEVADWSSSSERLFCSWIWIPNGAGPDAGHDTIEQCVHELAIGRPVPYADSGCAASRSVTHTGMLARLPQELAER